MTLITHQSTSLPHSLETGSRGIMCIITKIHCAVILITQGSLVQNKLVF